MISENPAEEADYRFDLFLRGIPFLGNCHQRTEVSGKIPEI